MTAIRVLTKVADNAADQFKIQRAICTQLVVEYLEKIAYLVVFNS
jgi:hypothetical protein